jgi:hypothetical protein
MDSILGEVKMIDSVRTQKIMDNYNRIGQAVRIRLLDRYPAKLIWGVIAETRRELAVLTPKIPFIGEKNIWQINLDTCVMNMALYRTLKKRRFELSEATQIQQDIFDAYLQSFPRPMRWVYRWYYLSPFHQKRLSQAAEKSQKRQYPGDWVFTYVEGNGHGFDYGVDISECAIVKLYRIHGVEDEYLPYLCKMDHAMSKILSLGITRNGTLAEGAPVCNCRWKRGAEMIV